jgi:hypothetical protein
MADNPTASLLKEYGRDMFSQAPDRTSLTSQQQPDDNKSPLIQRVTKLLAAMPHAEKARGVELLELQYRLKGRKGGRAHVGEIAECLRRLGYVRRRGWREGRTGFCARWYPPSL